MTAKSNGTLDKERYDSEHIPESRDPEQAVA